MHANHSFRKPYPFWCGRNSSITVKSQLLMHSASYRKTTDMFLSNMEHTATHHIRKAFTTARNRLLLLDGEQTMVSETA
jgi:negative regulator of sigma E activity